MRWRTRVDPSLARHGLPKPRSPDEAQRTQRHRRIGHGGEPRQTTAHVKIDIGGGNTITASITVEAVDDLALKAGDKVTAVIKASEVIVGK